MPKPKLPKIALGDRYQDANRTYEVDAVSVRRIGFFVLETGDRHSLPIAEFRRNFIARVGVAPEPKQPAEIAEPTPPQPEIPAPEPQRPATIADIARALGLKTQAGIHAFEIAVENIQLLDRKQQDYGPGNIAAFGEFGVLVRANDKIERLKNLHKTGRLDDPQNESVTDSWLDLSCYGIIAQLIRKGLWN
jgi:hypothetical protein